MKILAVADEESRYLWDFYQPGRLSGYNLIISCGDLKQEYLEFLVTLGNVPLVYVPGNHDKGYINFPPEGCECIDDRITIINGLRILGLGGCIRYNRGVYQYTEAEMARRVRKIIPKVRLAGGVDIIVTHAPPRGYGDAPDNAHRGFQAFLPLMDEFHPQYLIHGHVHPSYGDRNPQSVQYGSTTVYNAVGWHALEAEPGASKKPGFVRKMIYRMLSS